MVDKLVCFVIAERTHVQIPRINKQNPQRTIQALYNLDYQSMKEDATYSTINMSYTMYVCTQCVDAGRNFGVVLTNTSHLNGPRR